MYSMLAGVTRSNFYLFYQQTSYNEAETKVVKARSISFTPEVANMLGAAAGHQWQKLRQQHSMRVLHYVLTQEQMHTHTRTRTRTLSITAMGGTACWPRVAWGWVDRRGRGGSGGSIEFTTYFGATTTLTESHTVTRGCDLHFTRTLPATCVCE